MLITQKSYDVVSHVLEQFDTCAASVAAHTAAAADAATILAAKDAELAAHKVLIEAAHQHLPAETLGGDDVVFAIRETLRTATVARATHVESGFMKSVSQWVDEQKQKLDSISGTHSVTVRDLFAPAFLAAHGQLANIAALLEAAGVDGTQETFDQGSEALNDAVRAHTDFTDWAAMKAAAVEDWAARKYRGE